MPNKMIYLTDDLYEKVKDEENLSKLIQGFLSTVYKPKEIKVDEVETAFNKLEEEAKYEEEKAENLKLIEAKAKLMQRYEEYLKENNKDFHEVSYEDFLNKLQNAQ